MDVVMAANPFCVALTGGIASGKSTVAHYFAELGVPVIDADAIAHTLTAPGTPALNAIVAHFGASIIDHSKNLDRKKLRTIIFENPAERQWLETLLHPLIREKMLRAVQQTTHPYVICMIPLLRNKTDYPCVHRVLVIDASHQDQLTRAIQRDHMTLDHVEKIIAVQPTRVARNALADDVIENKGDLAMLRAQVKALHQRYLNCNYSLR